MSHYEYVGEIIHGRFPVPEYQTGVKAIHKSGRTVTRSRFTRLTESEDRQYAERFAKIVAPKFQPSKATYKTGKIGDRSVVAMYFSKYCWLFCEKRQPRVKPEAIVEQPV
jgi:hypothetical protein